ncbi:hypothetical protein [Flavihumibacter sp. CACIAM 22H1]|uniref:hypothetical protein n=1 Tax=Flavihumibacter sp. CACIAM 22H1 TaxID=1812911 RepID=UPI0007A8CA51|nr:hypothetical protein [Flavihumibacter sp. CACIAM 22H1]KYP12956.1 MAG: hypothetical protein A1D16_15810 [Flavihumibacter sp. CACIAM 22H1]
MKQYQIDQMSLLERAQAETPPFFVKLRNIALALAAVSASVATSPVDLPPLVLSIAGYLGVAAAAIGAVSQITVKS